MFSKSEEVYRGFHIPLIFILYELFLNKSIYNPSIIM